MNPLRASRQFPDILRVERWLHAFPRPSRGSRFVLAGYPAPYRIGMSNLGFHFLLGRLRKSHVLRLERFFTDTAPRTLESGTMISLASVLFVSISYEEDYLNLVRILLRAGIPPLRRERREGPIIIVGGPAPSANPFPLADIVDCCVLGEGERSLDDIVGIMEREPHARPERLIEAVAGLPTVFVGSVPAGGVGYPSPTGTADFPHSVVITPKTVFPDRLLVEIGRGCPGSCSFCLASALCRPYRAMPIDDLERMLDTITDFPTTAGLVSTAVAAHPRFDRVMNAFTARGMRVALSSIRAEDLDEKKITLIGGAGTRSVSFAPESGSEELRFHLGKRVPDETYIRAASALRRAGVRNFKLYLLVGCPGETGRDERETETFLREFGDAAGRSVSVNVNVVIPKAWTPMQFYAMPAERSLEESMRRLKKVCGGRGLAIRTKSVRSAVRQALFSMGDERVGRAIVRYAEGGISWKRALETGGVDYAMPHETRGIGTSLPWDTITGPVNREALERRYRQLVAPRRGSRNRT